jgi:hypothetical protein
MMSEERNQHRPIGADIPSSAMDEDSLRCVDSSVVEDHLPSGAGDYRY